MTKFEYLAKETPKKTVKGSTEASSIESAAENLRSRGLFPIQIKPKSSNHTSLSMFQLPGAGKVKVGTLSQFTENLANLLNSGLSLERALNLLESQTSHRLLKKVITEIYALICKGRSLAQALSVYPEIFSATYISMVKVGEEAGLLADMLEKLSKSLDAQYQMRNKLKASMVYPVFLSCVGLGTVIVLMVWVIPKFSSFFVTLEHQLPLPTRVVLLLSSILAKVWPFLLILNVVVVLFVLRLLKNKSFRLAFDKVCLKVPVFGEFVIKSQLAQLMYTLGILLTHGVNMLGALRITGDTLSNKYIAYQLHKAAEGVAKGDKLHECFPKNHVFTTTMLGVLAIGQESGMLPQMLMRMAKQYEQQTKRQIDILTNMIEPLMILTMGGVVGFIVVAMLMPIFKVSALVN